LVKTLERFEPISIDIRVFERYVSVIASFQLFLFAQILVLSHYFSFDPVASLIFFADDGHCLAATEGLGVHCFGDYAYVRNAIASGDPWGAQFRLPYPSLAIAPILLGLGAEVLFSSFNAGLVLYMFCLLAAVSSIWLFVIVPDSRIFLSTKILSVLVVGPLSLPALAILDRGNSTGFVVPVLLLLIVGIRRNRFSLVAVGIILASAVKPQFLLLVLILVSVRKLKLAIGTVLVAGLFQLGAYAPFGSRAPEFLVQTVRNMVGFGAHETLINGHPTNVSLANAFHLLVGRTLGWTESVSIVFSLAVCLSALIVLTLWSKTFQIQDVAVALIAISALFVPVTFSYYLIFAPFTIVMACLVRSHSIPVKSRKESAYSAANAAMLGVANVASATALLLPVSTSGEGTLLSSQEFTGGVWLLFLITLALKRPFLIPLKYGKKGENHEVEVSK